MPLAGAADSNKFWLSRLNCTNFSRAKGNCTPRQGTEKIRELIFGLPLDSLYLLHTHFGLRTLHDVLAGERNHGDPDGRSLHFPPIVDAFAVSIVEALKLVHIPGLV